MDLFELYAKESQKRKASFKAIDNIGYYEQLLEGLQAMFTRCGVPDNVSGIEYCETYLLQYGNMAIVKPIGYTGAFPPDYIVGWCSFGGELYADGIGSTAVFNSRSGYNYEFEDWKNNKDIVVSFNNKLKYPDMNIPKYARLLSECDTSLNLQVLYSRLYPVPLVKDEKSKKAVEDILNKIEDGKIKAIVSDNLKNVMIGDNTPSIDILNLTSNQGTEYIQYLTHYKDDLYRHFWSLYGMNTNGSTKLAQQTKQEITNGDGLSMIIPHDRYHCRKQEEEQVRNKFGWNDYTVSFSAPWVNQFAECAAEGEKNLLEESEEELVENEVATENVEQVSAEREE